MARERWNAVKNPGDALEGLLAVPCPKKNDEWLYPEMSETSNVSAQVLARCPWMCKIMKNLVPLEYDITLRDPKEVEYSDISGMMTSVENPLCTVLKLFVRNRKLHVSPIAYLAIIGACA